MLTPKVFKQLNRHRTLSQALRVCVAAASDPSGEGSKEAAEPLPDYAVEFEDVFENNALKIQSHVAETSHAIDLKLGTVLLF